MEIVHRFVYDACVGRTFQKSRYWCFLYNILFNLNRQIPTGIICRGKHCHQLKSFPYKPVSPKPTLYTENIHFAHAYAYIMASNTQSSPCWRCCRRLPPSTTTLSTSLLSTLCICKSDVPSARNFTSSNSCFSSRLCKSRRMILEWKWALF